MDLNDAISAAATLAAVGDQRINTILDFFFTTIRLDNSQQDALAAEYEAQVSQSHTDGGGGGWGVRSVNQSVPNRGVGGKTVPRSTTQSQTVAGRQCPGQSVSLRQMEDVPRSVSQSQTVGGRAQVSQSDTDRWGKCPGQSVSHGQLGDVPMSVSQSQRDGG